MKSRGLRCARSALVCGAVAVLCVGCSSGGNSRSATVSSSVVPSTRASVPPPDPFDVGELIGLGDWQLFVEPASVGPTEIRVPVRLLNKHPSSERLESDGLFTLRNGVAGPDLAPASVEGLRGRVAGNATATGTVVFRPAAPVAQPVLYFHGRPLQANSAYVALG